LMRGCLAIAVALCLSALPASAEDWLAPDNLPRASKIIRSNPSIPALTVTTSAGATVSLAEQFSGRPTVLFSNSFGSAWIDVFQNQMEVVSASGSIAFAPNEATALVMQTDGGVSLGNAGDPGGAGIIGLQAYAIAGLPTCNSTSKGAHSYVTNGVTSPTFLATVSTTGAVVAPVFCNGTNWIYY
jgi:hypothetical protein